jgi:hypothetical protein
MKEPGANAGDEIDGEIHRALFQELIAAPPLADRVELDLRRFTKD